MRAKDSFWNELIKTRSCFNLKTVFEYPRIIFSLQKRDVGIAFVMVALTYGLVGLLFLLTFPLAKTCISGVDSQVWELKL